MTNYTLKYIEYLLKKFSCLFISDYHYRKNRFVRNFGYCPDMQHPITFNEKLMYRALQPHDPTFTAMADKIQARQIVRKKLGCEYLVPLVGIWDTTEEIPLDSLPDRFVLKCNHDAGSTVVCRGKNTHDFAATFRKLNFCLKRNMYYTTREWQYKNISPVIMCEEYIDTSHTQYQGYTADVWHVHCFHGKPHFLEVEFLNAAGVRHSGIYDPQWSRQQVEMGYPGIPINPPVPGKLAIMLGAAATLAARLDYCRIDFYLSGDNLYFSEFTLIPANGRRGFLPDYWDIEFGNLWRLPSPLCRVGDPSCYSNILSERDDL
ncbi:ATP-grasp fold amidoligase family protein [Trabulsiella odontotermitis]|uniref:ATP-grasp fold amidoligase family protein n=1 Tax=Trabulsiella odontotermitis TaxID=379893 RepID=UPI000676A07E|nr:ATP-grasp fold amidoligase family protein [Trabulsiella odontotermitis]